jgi:cytochrome bd-type quinol oxidase subunit 2
MDKYFTEETLVSKSVLAGVFAGIIATLSNLAYDYAVRMTTQFAPSQIVNVATIIFGTMLLFSVSGLIFYWASHFIKKGETIYVMVFATLTAVCFWLGMHANRSADPQVSANFRILLLGIIGISGLLATFYIPYLMKHSSIFLDHND